MPEQVKPYQCRHIFTEGRQCGSPALRGEKLCYYHHASRRPLPRRPEDTHATPNLPAPDDLHAVQRALGEVLRLIATETIADGPARLLLAGLASASTNLARIARQERAARLDRVAELRLTLKARAQGHPGLAPEIAEPIHFVDDLVHDPVHGNIAPGPEPEPRPGGPVAQPSLALTPKPLGMSLEETAAIYAKVEQANAASVQARQERRQRLEAESKAEFETQSEAKSEAQSKAAGFPGSTPSSPSRPLEVQPYLLLNEGPELPNLKIPDNHHRSARQLNLPNRPPFLNPQKPLQPVTATANRLRNP